MSREQTTIVFSSIYPEITSDNFLFSNRKHRIGDDLFAPLSALKDRMLGVNVSLCTPDLIDWEKISAVVFLDMPKQGDALFEYARSRNVPSFLGVGESLILHPENGNRAKQEFFRKIFTYYDPSIDNVRYFKTNYSFEFPRAVAKDPYAKRKLCTMISCNKTLNHPLELYSKRVEAIRWFERHHADDFDLYGIGWDEPNYFHGSTFIRALNHSRMLRRLLSKPFPSYRGPVERKHDVLRRYRFSICYENARDIPGWITEKIFDCFFAGCVPVYWGANNVTDH
ncbi:hypothetical protein ACFL01_03235, partial [Planctomycetota bacterium]